MINNDNLAVLAGAAVFAGVASLAGPPFWMAAGLAMAGWPKLTALLAIGLVVGCFHPLRLLQGDARL